MEGESYFSIGLNKSYKMKPGWIVSLQFCICLHKKDLYILQLIKIKKILFFLSPARLSKQLRGFGGIGSISLSWGK